MQLPSSSSSLLRLTFHASSSRHAIVAAPRLFTSSSSQCARQTPADAAREAAASSSVVNLGARSAGFVAAKDAAGNPIGREPGPLYREWLASEGSAFRTPRPHETNYLGGEVPFPLNPSFKPPPPLSDRLRTLIFNEWYKNPEQNNPRALSIRHGISIKRVEAIIRLKVHEHKWKQDGKPLQTGFLDAFESATGVYKNVPPHKMRTRTPPEQMDRDMLQSPREDAAAADYDADWEQLPTQEISRVYWESVAEGHSPIVPAKLDEVANKKLAANRAQATPASAKKIGATTFVDVGDKFAHSHASVKRTDPRYRGPLWKPNFSV